jgi:hypothetical protein
MRFGFMKSILWVIFCGVLAAAQQLEPLPPSQSVIPAFVTADSGVKNSGVGTRWSEWYRLEVGRAPNGYTIQNSEFWLTGARRCGFLAECRELARTDDQVIWEFRLRGEDRAGLPMTVISEGHIRVTYRLR